MVAEFGEAAVWSAGLKALGYPPTWIHCGYEKDLVQEALEAKRKEHPNGNATCE